MRLRFVPARLAAALAASLLLVACAPPEAPTEAPAGPPAAAATGTPADTTSEIPRLANGRPNFSGVWQSLTTANWDIEAHGAASGPYPELLGAWGAQPGGVSIIEGGTIPYQPWALEKRRENFERRLELSVPGDGVDPPLGEIGRAHV